MRSRLRPILSQAWPLYLLLLSLPAVATLLLYGLPVTDDGLTHLWRIARLHDSLTSIDLFPRWLPEMLLGLGYPLLNYYASSTYYLVEFFHLLGFHLPNALIAVNCLLVWAAGIGIYLLARDSYERQQPWAAPVASVAYLYAPYLLVNIYVRGAIAEIGAQALFPWIFWGFQRLWRAEKPERYLMLTTLTLGALAFTHSISLLIIPPLLIVYTLVLYFSSPGSNTESGADKRTRLVYTVLAIAGAVAITAFFWAPLLFERQYVGNSGFDAAISWMLPNNFQAWSDLVDPHLLYAYAHGNPWQLGLIQVGAALVGVICLLTQWRNLARKSEWAFWLGVPVLCLVLMVEVSKPFWFSNNIMPIIQFPWRFLALLQLPIALFTAFPITLLQQRPLRVLGVCAGIVLLIFVHWPRIVPEAVFDAKNSQFNLAVHAYYDPIRGEIAPDASNYTGLLEFQPRGATESMLLDPTSVAEPASPPTPDRKVSVVAANSTHLQLAVAGSAPSLLRFATYYFPGWTVLLDGTETLVTYPTTNLGLLTVDLPPGEHTLEVLWSGTSLQFWSGLISQIAIALLCLFLLWWRRERGWLLLLLPLLLFGLVATYARPQPLPIHGAKLASTPAGLEFLGYAGPRVEEQGIYLSTYWLATETPPANIQSRWQLLATDGNVVQELTARPFYDRYSSQYWAANTMVDDGYWLPLPPDLPAGNYTVQMTLLHAQTGEEYSALEVGSVQLAQPTATMQPAHALDVAFGENVRLTGYDQATIGPSLPPTPPLHAHPEMLTLNAGETLEYRLYWQTAQASKDSLVGFIHLVDAVGKPYVQQDQFPGPWLQPSGLWTAYGTYPDRYLLATAPAMPSGLYVANVGMYKWHDDHRFEVTIPGVEGIYDHYELPPVKVINRTLRPSGTPVRARIDDFAELLRFEVEGGEVAGEQRKVEGISMSAGGTLTLTTYYEAQAPSPTALTRYVQVRDAQNQILAQVDSEPQGGSNPTWAWLPGEIVKDVIALMLPAESAEGEYTLYLGWYDAAANFAHPPTFDQQGNRLPNDEIPLLQVSITP